MGLVFGKVLEGMDIVRHIEMVPRNADDRPLQEVIVVASGEISAA